MRPFASCCCCKAANLNFLREEQQRAAAARTTQVPSLQPLQPQHEHQRPVPAGQRAGQQHVVPELQRPLHAAGRYAQTAAARSGCVPHGCSLTSTHQGRRSVRPSGARRDQLHRDAGQLPQEHVLLAAGPHQLVRRTGAPPSKRRRIVCLMCPPSMTLLLRRRSPWWLAAQEPAPGGPWRGAHHGMVLVLPGTPLCDLRADAAATVRVRDRLPLVRACAFVRRSSRAHRTCGGRGEALREKDDDDARACNTLCYSLHPTGRAWRSGRQAAPSPSSTRPSCAQTTGGERGAGCHESFARVLSHVDVLPWAQTQGARAGGSAVLWPAVGSHHGEVARWCCSSAV